MVADRDVKGAEAVAEETKAIAGKEAVGWTSIDIRDRKAIKTALDVTVKQFGGIDILINTAALFPSSPDGVISDAQWALTLEVNVTANYFVYATLYAPNQPLRLVLKVPEPKSEGESC